LGIKSGKNSRSVIIRFSFYSDREAVWLAKSKLKGSNLFIREDFCKSTLTQRAKLVPILKSARLAEHKCAIVGDSLILDGKRYNPDDLNKLPSHLSSSSVSSRSNDKGHAFYGKNNPLSNFYYSPFTMNGIKFTCAEQCYQYHKATYFKDTNTASDILRTVDPSVQKRLSKDIADYCEATWELVANEVMHSTILAKFSGNEFLINHLTSTGDKDLYEASPHDLYWGIGVSLSNKNILDPKFHKGLNNLGKIMVSVREQIKGSLHNPSNPCVP
jgi:hypothetical protein